MAVSTAAEARALAAAFTQSFGPAFLDNWTDDRGGPIDLDALSPSPRVFPLHTVFEPAPEVGCHPAYVRLFGSYYLLTLDDGIDPRVRMAVSAQTTEYSVDANGELVQPSRSGNDFEHEGIHASGNSRMLLSPEQAVALTARATGRRVTAVPRLSGRGALFVATAALWRVVLDGPVSVRGANGQVVQSSELFVSSEAAERFFVANEVQPISETIDCPLIDENLVEHGHATITVGIRPGEPTEFSSVSLLP